MNKMIQIENISKVFRTTEVETVALNHVNLEVKEGEFVAIMGPSGCGRRNNEPRQSGCPSVRSSLSAPR